MDKLSRCIADSQTNLSLGAGAEIGTSTFPPQSAETVLLRRAELQKSRFRKLQSRVLVSLLPS